MGIQVQSRLLTPLEASGYLGVSSGTLANWRSLKRYDLPFIKVGKRGYVRYRKSDIDEFLERNTERAVA
jgi:excisionase family DNA binding protein